MALIKFDKLKQNTLDAVKSVKGKVDDIRNSEVVKSVQNKIEDIKTSEVVTNLSQKTDKLKEQTKANIDKIKDSKVIKVVGNKFHTISTNEDVLAVWNKTTDISSKVGKTTLKGLKVITGISAISNRKQAIKTKEDAEALKKEIEETNESIRDDLNETLEEFGKVRLTALHNTVGQFLLYLDKINQNIKAKEYDFLREIDISYEEIQEMKKIDMKASDAIKVAAVGGGFAAIALAGTGPLVTSAVAAFATASTGTAISSLSGAAATNAILAWLGGGSIAAGGGGIAAGTVVLHTIIGAATAGVAIIAIGTLTSAFYAKKNTEATKYMAEIQEWAEQVKTSWVVLGGIKERVLELQDLTQQLENKTISVLNELGEIIDVFDANDIEHTRKFQNAAILVKSMSELAQVPVLDNEGNLNDQVSVTVAKTQKVLNSEL